MPATPSARAPRRNGASGGCDRVASEMIAARRLIALVCLAVAAAASSLHFVGRPQPLNDSANFVEGTVRDDAGRVADARVRFQAAGSFVTTDAAGHFRLPRVERLSS